MAGAYAASRAQLLAATAAGGQGAPLSAPPEDFLVLMAARQPQWLRVMQAAPAWAPVRGLSQVQAWVPPSPRASASSSGAALAADSAAAAPPQAPSSSLLSAHVHVGVRPRAAPAARPPPDHHEGRDSSGEGSDGEAASATPRPALAPATGALGRPPLPPGAPGSAGRAAAEPPTAATVAAEAPPGDAAAAASEQDAAGAVDKADVVAEAPPVRSLRQRIEAPRGRLQQQQHVRRRAAAAAAAAQLYGSYGDEYYDTVAHLRCVVL